MQTIKNWLVAFFLCTVQSRASTKSPELFSIEKSLVVFVLKKISLKQNKSHSRSFRFYILCMIMRVSQNRLIHLIGSCDQR